MICDLCYIPLNDKTNKPHVCINCDRHYCDICYNINTETLPHNTDNDEKEENECLNFCMGCNTEFMKKTRIKINKFIHNELNCAVEKELLRILVKKVLEEQIQSFQS